MNDRKKTSKKKIPSKVSSNENNFLKFLEKLSDKTLAVDVLHCNAKAPNRFRFRLHKESLSLCTATRFNCDPCSISFHAKSFEIAEPMVFFIYIMVGSCSVSSKQDFSCVRRLTADQFMFVDASKPIEMSSEVNFEVTIIMVPEAYVQTHTAYRVLDFSGERITSGNASCALFTKIFRETLRTLPKIPKRFHEVLLDGIFFFLRPVLSDAESFKELQVKNRMDYLHLEAERILLSRFCEPRLEMVDVANELGISVRYLSRVFKKSGTTFSEELMRLRLNKAGVMLREEHCMNLSISDIARKSRFTCLSHFSRSFKAFFGKTPTEMRGGEVKLENRSFLDKTKFPLR